MVHLVAVVDIDEPAADITGAQPNADAVVEFLGAPEIQNVLGHKCRRVAGAVHNEKISRRYLSQFPDFG